MIRFLSMLPYLFVAQLGRLDHQLRMRTVPAWRLAHAFASSCARIVIGVAILGGVMFGGLAYASGGGGNAWNIIRVSFITPRTAGGTVTIENQDGTDWLTINGTTFTVDVGGGADEITCTSGSCSIAGGVPDPIVPADGNQDLTGSLDVTGNTDTTTLTSGNLQIEGGGNLQEMWVTTVSPGAMASIAAGTCTNVDVTLSGTDSEHDVCLISMQNGQVGSTWFAQCGYYCTVQGANSIRVTRCNWTTAALDCDGSNNLPMKIALFDFD